MNGLAPRTSAIIESVSRLDCIKPYVLVGGTALSLQLGTRLSEDLDFMSWRKGKNDKREVDWPLIKRELGAIGTVESCDILDLDHVEFIVDGSQKYLFTPVQISVRYKRKSLSLTICGWPTRFCRSDENGGDAEAKQISGLL